MTNARHPTLVRIALALLAGSAKNSVPTRRQRPFMIVLSTMRRVACSLEGNSDEGTARPLGG